MFTGVLLNSAVQKDDQEEIKYYLPLFEEVTPEQKRTQDDKDLLTRARNILSGESSESISLFYLNRDLLKLKLI